MRHTYRILVFGAILLVAGCGVPGASGSSSPTPSASVEADPSASASASASSAAPSATPEPPPGTGSWTMTHTVDADPGSAVATDVAWEGGFVAIGHVRANDSVVSDPSPRIWRSTDGLTWTEEMPDLGVDLVALIGIEVQQDGQFMLVGQTGLPMNPAAQGTAAWLSPDGVDWEPIDMPMDGPALAFDRGALGYILVAGDELWFSADGESWSMTAEGVSDAAAGDEGFVAVQQTEEGRTPATLASSDGVTWFESGDFASFVLDVAPLAGDWFATGMVSGDTGAINVWHSENGLDWTSILDVNDLTPADGPKTGRGMEYDSISGASLAVGAGGSLFITLTNNHCCAMLPWNHGVWETVDGETWEQVVEGDAFVASATGEAELNVMVGHLGRGDDAAFWLLDQ